MTLANDLKEFSSSFSSSYKMFTDAEEKRAAHEETARHNKETEALNTERVRGASAGDLAGADAITKKYQTSTDTPGGGGSVRVPSTKEQDALAGQYHSYLTDKLGYSNAAASGILGNMKQESSFNPNAAGDKGSAHGLFQWRGDRFTNLQNFAASQKKDWHDPYVQLDFMHQELTKGGYGKAYQGLMGAKNAAQAADAFALNYERPRGAETGDPNNIHGIQARRGYANQLFGTRQDVAARPRSEPNVTSTAIPPPVGAQTPGQTATKPKPKPEEPQEDINLQPIASLEEEEVPAEYEDTAFGAAGGAVPDPSGNFGAPRGYTQAPSSMPGTSPTPSGARVGGTGFVPRRVGQPAPGSTGAGAIPMPAGVGYGIGQATPGQQALRDRRQGKIDAANAAAAAAAAAKPAAAPVGNQWEGKYGNMPDATGYTTPWGGKQPGMTTEQLQALPDKAFSGNPQAFAATHPGTENYVRWRVGEDAWARGQQQQQQWGGQYANPSSSHAAGGPVERSYAEGGSVERPQYLAEGGVLEREEEPAPAPEPEFALPPPEPAKEPPKRGTIAASKAGYDTGGTGRARVSGERTKEKQEEEDDAPAKAVERLKARALARLELARGAEPKSPAEDARKLAEQLPGPSKSQTRGRGAAPQQGPPIPEAPVTGVPVTDSEGNPIAPPPSADTGPPAEAIPPPPTQARGAYGGRMGAPSGVNAPPTPPTPVAGMPVTDSEGNPIAPPIQGPDQPPPPPAQPSAIRPAGVPATDSEGNPIAGPSLVAPGAPPEQQGPAIPPNIAAAEGAPAQGPPLPSTPLRAPLPPKRPDTTATGSIAPEPQPGKPTPGQKIINHDNKPNDELAGPSLERGLKLKEKKLRDGKPAIGGDDGGGSYGKGDEVMTGADYRQLQQTVDPHNQLNAAERNIAMYQELQDYWLAKGNPAKAAEASLGLTMYNRRAAQAAGGMALAALGGRGGQPPGPQDVMNSARWLSKAFNTVPNNQHLMVTPNEKDPTKVDYVVLDGQGKELQNGTADSAQLAAMAKSTMSGEQFDQSLWEIVNGRRGGGRAGAGAAGGPKETDYQRKQARNAEMETVHKEAVDIGKKLKENPDDAEAKAAFEEKISRLRTLGGPAASTDKAIKQAYIDAGLTPPETATGKEGVKAKAAREAEEKTTARKKAIADAEAAGDPRKALDLNLQHADEAFGAQKVQSSGKQADYDTALDDAKVTDPDERKSMGDAATEIMSRNKGATPAQAVRALAALKAAAAARSGKFEFDDDGRVRIPGMESRPLFISGKMIKNFMTGAPGTTKKAAPKVPQDTSATPRYQPNQPPELGA